MTKLSVNLNKFALLRNSRGNDYPNLLSMARRALAMGIDGLTVHPRPDERHATYRDVSDLRALVAAHEGVEFNVEGNPIERFLEVVEQQRPHQCTLVPDAANQLTSDHGYDLLEGDGELGGVIARLQAAGIRVSIFMDADVHQVEQAPGTGAQRIELYTEPYAAAFGSAAQEAVTYRFRQAAQRALSLGLAVNAGHDLNLGNLGYFLQQVPGISEVSIGHAIVVESFDYGFENTLERYLRIVRG
jgi:pyridoxine 5-phosphate synthase